MVWTKDGRMRCLPVSQVNYLARHAARIRLGAEVQRQSLRRQVITAKDSPTASGVRPSPIRSCSPSKITLKITTQISPAVVPAVREEPELHCATGVAAVRDILVRNPVRARHVVLPVGQRLSIIAIAATTPGAATSHVL